MKAVKMVMLCQLLLPVISLDVDGVHIVLPNKQPAPDISLKWFRPKAAPVASSKSNDGAEKSSSCLCDQNKTQELENRMMQLQDVVRHLTENKTEGQGNKSLSRVTDNRNALLFEIMQDQLKNCTKELEKLDLTVSGLQEQMVEVRNDVSGLQAIHWGSGGYTASNGLSYKITSTLQSFEESRTACQKMGGHLAYIGIRNATIYSEIFSHLGSDWSEAFIDLSRNETAREFQWPDGIIVSQDWAPWYTGQPNSQVGDEDCVEIIRDYGGLQLTWNDKICQAKRKAVCER